MSYELTDNIAIVTIDDGKANVVGHNFLDSINADLDRALADQAGAIILRGREGIFSAGFDLAEFQKGVEAGVAMVSRGVELLIRLYSFPLPLVAAVTGHGIAMGAFVILACDSRIGSRGKFKITLPETALGMDLPLPMLSLTQSRISSQYLTRAVIQAEVFDPDQAVVIGFLDEAVEREALDVRAMAVAQQLAALPQKTYANNKLAVRRVTLEAMREQLANSMS